jgi:hypothetical protein
MNRCLGDNASTTKSVLGEFRRDETMFCDLSTSDTLMAKEKQVFSRHLFQTRSVQQYREACKGVGIGPALNDDLRRLIWMRAGGNCATEINEEIIGANKNAKVFKCVSRYRRPEVSTGRVLQSSLLVKRFGFDQVQADVAPDIQSEKLLLSAFQSSPDDWCLPFRKVQGTTQNAPFYSPSAKNNTVRDADIYAPRRSSSGLAILDSEC